MLCTCPEIYVFESVRTLHGGTGAEIQKTPRSVRSDLLADLICPQINFTSRKRFVLVQVFRQEKSLAVRMIYKFSTLFTTFYIIHHFGNSWKSTTRLSTSISTAGSILQEAL